MEVAAAEGRFDSFPSLKAESDAILSAMREDPYGHAYVHRAVGFIARARATGVLLGIEEDRLAAQALVDYWSTVVFRKGVPLDDTALLDFDESLAPILPDERCPYRGLRPFLEADQPFFFGRDRLLTESLLRLERGRWLGLVGPSGSGKSSFVRAKLLPALRAGAVTGSSGWTYVGPFVPGSDPHQALRDAISVALSAHAPLDQRAVTPPALSDLLRSAPQTLVIVDQFEEIYTLCTDDGLRAAFLTELLEFANDGGCVVLTMRSDRMDYIALRTPDLARRFEESTLRVGPLTAAELRLAIEQPANLVGLRFESGIVEKLVDEVLGEPAGLPLLQFVLKKLWERRSRNIITWQAYSEVGHWSAALTRAAHEFYVVLPIEERDVVRRVFLRIVKVPESSEPFANRVALSVLRAGFDDVDRFDRVLKKLLDAHLIRESESRSGADTQYEVAHESLLRNWEELTQWIDKDRFQLRRREELAQAARAWDRKREPSALLRGPLLDETLRTFQGEMATLNHVERIFLEASQRAAARRRLTGQLVVVGSIVTLGLVALWLLEQKRIADDARAVAEESARIAAARRLTAEVRVNVDDRLDLALLLAVHAYALDPSVDSRSALLFALQRSPQLITFLRGNPGVPSLLAFARRDGQVVSVGADGSVVRWRADTGEQMGTGRLWSSRRDHVAVSRDGSHVAIASLDPAVVTVFETASGTEVFSGRATDLTSLAMSDDGRILAIGTPYDVRTVHLAGGPRTVRMRPRGLRGAFALAFGPSNRLAAVDEHAVVVFDVQTGRQLASLRPPAVANPAARLQADARRFWPIAMSPDGRFVATSEWDSGLADHARVTVYDVNRVVSFSHIVRAHRAAITTLAFSDTNDVISGGEDNVILISRVFDRQGRLATISSLTGHARPIHSVASYDAGRRLVSADVDGRLMLWAQGDAHVLLSETPRPADWQVNPPSAVPRVAQFSASDRAARVVARQDSLGGEPTRVFAWMRRGNSLLPRESWVLPNSVGAASVFRRSLLRMSPTPCCTIATARDGSDIVATSGREVAVWPLEGGPASGVRIAMPSDVTAVAVSSDGRTFAAGTIAGGVYTFSRDNLIPRALPLDQRTRALAIGAAAVSADGRLIAATAGGRLTVWNAETGQIAARLPHAPSRGDAPALPYAANLRAVAFSADASLLGAAADDNAVFLWTTHDWATYGESLTQLQGSASSLTFSADRTLLAAGSSDGTVGLWQIPSVISARSLPQFIGRLGRMGNRVDTYALAFNDKISTLAATYDGAPVEWTVDVGAWLRLACRMANRHLDRSERQQFWDERRRVPEPCVPPAASATAAGPS